MFTPVGQDCLDQLFLQARSHNGWADDPVGEDLIRRLYEVLKFGPTSANASPARFVFLTSEAGKQRLAPHVSDGNRPKMLQAPCTVIIGHDLDFPPTLTRLFPHDPTAPSWFADPAVAAYEAMRSGTLQGGYLLLAARALGLETGPMGGFDRDAVDRAFFAGTNVKSNFLCSLGKGTDHRLFPRLPRLDFDEACRIV